MKKKMFKGLGLSLCAMLLLAGCSCKKDDSDTKANINNPSSEILSGLKDGIDSITLQKLYDDLKAANGNTVAANKLLEIVSNIVLSDQTWKDRYDAKVEEKLSALTKSDDYKTNGVFDEELLVKTLRTQTYNITCTNNTYGPTYDEDGEVEDYMVCDYSDYIEKAVKLTALRELLNEKYVYDKVMVDKTNILSTKKARLVEYIALGYTSDDEEDEVIAHIVEAIKDLSAENSEVTLKDIADAWTQEQIDNLEEEYNKLYTSDDSNGSIMQDFTDGYTRLPEEGLKVKKQEIYNTVNYDEVVITSDSSSILNSTLVERLLSENVLTANAKKTIEINGSYYLVAPWAGNSIDSSDIRIKDSTNSKYYIVKVDVINNESTADMIYEAVKVLATNTSLVSDSVNYYLDQNKNNIRIYDEEIYNYLKTQYKDIFVD